jgi:hypothetical protein
MQDQKDGLALVFILSFPSPVFLCAFIYRDAKRDGGSLFFPTDIITGTYFDDFESHRWESEQRFKRSVRVVSLGGGTAHEGQLYAGSTCTSL